MVETKAWGDMSPQEREAAVRELMAKGGSNASVAKELDTTPGTIAGFRYKRGIPSTNASHGGYKEKEPAQKARAMPAPKPEARKAPAARAKPSPAPAAEPARKAVAERKPQPIPAPEPAAMRPSESVMLKLAASEATQCVVHDEDGKRCGYERAPGSLYCGLPHHQAIGKKLQKKPARR